MEDDQALAKVARALAHPARIRIVRLLASQTECRGADVFAELPLAQSTVSEHLRILKNAGIVSARPDGLSTVYCLKSGSFDHLIGMLSEIAAAPPACTTEGMGC